MASERDLPTEPLRPREAVDPAMAVIDTHGTVTGWTPAAADLLGRPAADVVGRSATALLTSSEDISRAAEAVEHSRTRGSWTGLTTLLHRSGRPVEVGLRVCPLSGAEGRKSWLVAVVDLGRAPSWVLGGPVLEAFLTRSPLSMAVLSPDLRYVWINDELERLGGVPREERLGRRLGDTLPGLDTRALEAQMRRVLATGAPVIDYEYRGWTPAQPHREHAYSTSFFRLDDADGDAIGLCYMVMDVTERWRARERLTLINEAGTRIGSTLDVEHTRHRNWRTSPCRASPTSSPSTWWNRCCGARSPRRTRARACPRSGGPGCGRSPPGPPSPCPSAAAGPPWTPRRRSPAPSGPARP